MTQRWVVALLVFPLNPRLLFSIFPSLIRGRSQSYEAVWWCQLCERGKTSRRLNYCLVLLPSGHLPAPRRTHMHPNLRDMRVPGQAIRCNQGLLNERVISNCMLYWCKRRRKSSHCLTIQKSFDELDGISLSFVICIFLYIRIHMCVYIYASCINLTY